jgi:hypothetical protein
MSDRSKIGAGVLVVAAAVGLFVVLSGDDDSKDTDGKGKPYVIRRADGPGPGPAKPAIPVIRLRDGEPVGGEQDIDVTSGERVRFKVTSDIDGEVHVHGYDFEKPVKAGGSVGFDFPANLEGGFEIELHHGGGENEIAGLKVEPG